MNMHALKYTECMIVYITSFNSAIIYKPLFCTYNVQSSLIAFCMGTCHILIICRTLRKELHICMHAAKDNIL